MQKLSSLLFTTLISISIVVVAHESMAQTSPTPSKAGTRLITLGTTAGPPTSERSVLFSSPTITMITRRVLVR